MELVAKGLVAKGVGYDWFGHHFWRMLVAIGAIGGIALVWTAEARAQEPVTTGIIDYVSPADGTLRLRSAQIFSRPLVFYGMNSANFMTVSGQLARLEDLVPGMAASIFFARHGRGWIISKVVIEDEDPCWEPLINPPVQWPDRVTRADLDAEPSAYGPDRAYHRADRTRIPAQGPRGGIHRRAP